MTLSTTIKIEPSIDPGQDVDDIVTALRRHGITWYEVGGDGTEDGPIVLEVKTSQLLLVAALLVGYRACIFTGF